jgi:hypothetical protein
MDLKYMECGEVERILLVQKSEKKQAFLNMVMNLRVT